MVLSKDRGRAVAWLQAREAIIPAPMTGYLSKVERNRNAPVSVLVSVGFSFPFATVRGGARWILTKAHEHGGFSP